VVRLWELMIILDLHRQGLSPGLNPTDIARQLGVDCKTVRNYIARGTDSPNYRSQPPPGRDAPATSCRISGNVWLLVYRKVAPQWGIRAGRRARYPFSGVKETHNAARRQQPNVLRLLQ
jgi:hypothetical protein